MVFSNLLFLYVFLPFHFLLYHLVSNRKVKNGVIIAFSVVFYAWGEPVWVILLLLSAALNTGFGLLLEGSQAPGRRRAVLWLAVGVNLGLLGIFKYSGFLVENINALFRLSLPLPVFSLPIGISFYTFQALSYVLDVYRGEVKAQRSYWKFLMYLSMFYQLIAGPIVRYQTVAEEIDDRTVTLKDVSEGLTRFIAGLGKKVVFANVAGDLASRYLNGDLSSLPAGCAWFGILMFTLQIYYDFSGYSDMAIGLGRMFGFHFLENFNYPYVSRSASEFWRRWHISLGSFFRDYLYIPLGGNRRHVYRNLFIVWFFTGLWHGASWNFILWGLFYGVLIGLERLFLGRALEKVPPFFRHVYLLGCVILGWVLFYYTDLSKTGALLQSMLGLNGAGFGNTAFNFVLVNHIFWIVAAVLGCTPVIPALQKRLERRGSNSRFWAALRLWGPVLVSGLVLFVSTALLVGQSYNPFLYFRF